MGPAGSQTYSTLRKSAVTLRRLLVCSSAAAAAATVAAPPLRNLLFIVADDLRPELAAAYASPHMVTPRADAFAREAATFERAYCNFAICSPSRNSFMTGRAPDRTRVWNFLQDFRSAGVGATGLPGKDWETLPQFFKQHGYLTLGHGKTFHPDKPPLWDEPRSWSQEQRYGEQSISNCGGNATTAWRFCPTRGRPADQYSDYNTTVAAAATLARMAANASRPFALFLGLHNPHGAWSTPAEIMDLDPAATSMAPPRFAFSPRGAPDVAFTAELDGDDVLAMDFSEPALANRSHDPGLPDNASGVVAFKCPSPGNNTVPQWFSQYMRLGYRTAVTATDTHLGMMLDALERSGRAADTLVVFVGDHGWQIGEHTEYGKHTNFDLAVHVPLMMRAPWLSGSAGARVQTAFELLDLYRTLAALVGLPAPPADVEGDDLSAALAAPARILKAEAYAQYSRCPGERNFPDNIANAPDWQYNNCEDVPVRNISFMGYSVRTGTAASAAGGEYRFTEWYSWDREACTARFEDVRGTELYNHSGIAIVGDFDSAENENIAAAPGSAAVVQALRALLWTRFRGREGSGCPPDQNATAISRE